MPSLKDYLFIAFCMLLLLGFAYLLPPPEPAQITRTLVIDCPTLEEISNRVREME